MPQIEINEPAPMPTHQTQSSIPVIAAKYVPTTKVTVAVAAKHPKKSFAFPPILNRTLAQTNMSNNPTKQRLVKAPFKYPKSPLAYHGPPKKPVPKVVHEKSSKLTSTVTRVKDAPTSKILLRFHLPIFQANKLAEKFATAPKVTSMSTLGIGLTTLLITQPTVTPTTAGQPKTIDKGIKASATRT